MGPGQPLETGTMWKDQSIHGPVFGAITKVRKRVSWSHCPGELWGLVPIPGVRDTESPAKSGGPEGCWYPVHRCLRNICSLAPSKQPMVPAVPTLRPSCCGLVPKWGFKLLRLKAHSSHALCPGPI